MLQCLAFWSACATHAQGVVTSIQLQTCATSYMDSSSETPYVECDVKLLQMMHVTGHTHNKELYQADKKLPAVAAA